MPDTAAQIRKTYGPDSFGRIELLLIFLSLIAAVLLGEVLVRLGAYAGWLFYPSPKLETIIHRYSANPLLVYELKPSTQVNSDGVVIRTNSWGMRDYEYSLLKPAGVKRIAVIGDSVTFGQILPFHQQTFPKQLEAQLNYEGGREFEVLNFSVVGYNSAQEEIVLRDKVLRFNPDLVIVGFCLNDDTFTDGLAELSRQTAPWSLGSRMHSKLVSSVLHRVERLFFRSRANSEQIRHLFQSLSELGKKHGFKTMVLVFPYFFEDLNNYRKLPMHTLVGRLARDHDLPVLDYLDLWKDLDPDTRRKLYAPKETVHFSSYGMRQVASHLAADLRSDIFRPDGVDQSGSRELFDRKHCIVLAETAETEPRTPFICPKGSLAVAWSRDAQARVTCCPLGQPKEILSEDAAGDATRENGCGDGEAIGGLYAGGQSTVFCRRLNERLIEAKKTRSFFLDSVTAWRPELQAIAAEYPSGACACPANAALVGRRTSSSADCDETCIQLGK